MNLQNQFVFDVEADGPCAGLYSMIELGIVNLQDLNRKINVQFRPITGIYDKSALNAIGRTREETAAYPVASMGMCEVMEFWYEFNLDRAVMWSDNPAFDWQFLNFYMHSYIGRNPFGFSARRIGDLAAGMRRKPGDHTSWKAFRQTRHSHKAVDDALGNAEALRYILGGNSI